MKKKLLFAVVALVAWQACKKSDKPIDPVTNPPQPTALSISDFNPKSAMVDETVMITGTAFGTDVNAIGVKFGTSESIKPITVSDNQITVKVPASAKTGVIEVSVNGKSETSSATFTLTEKPAPVVSIASFTPSSASAGSTMEIIGAAFGTDTNFVALTIGTSKTFKPKSVTPTKITLVIPNDATTGNVGVSVNGATAVTSKDQFTLTVQPLSLREFSPNNGKVNTEVVITGTGFGTDVNAVKIFFGNSDGVKPTAITPTRMVVKVPATSTMGKVKVVLNNGTPVISIDDFNIQLSVTSISPKSATVGETIKISGAGFGNDPDKIAIYWNNNASTLFTRPIKATPNELTVVVPVIAKSGNIRVVSVSGEEDLSPEPFTFIPQVQFTGPIILSTRINAVVGFTGNFSEADIKTIGVSFGGSEYVQPVFINSSWIYIKVPSDAKTGKVTIKRTGYSAFTGDFTMQIEPETPKSGPWLRMSDGLGGRRNAAVFTIGTKAYVGTGQTDAPFDGTGTVDFFEYNGSVDVWLKKADFKGGFRLATAAFSIGNIGYVGTGLDRNSKATNDFWAFDPVNNTWTQKASFKGEARGNAVGFSANGKGYIGTGSNGSTSYSDFYAYDAGNNSWQQITSIGGARSGAFVFVIDNKAYVGNGISQSGTYLNDFSMYDPQTNVWTSKASIPAFASSASVALAVDGKGIAGLGLKDGSLTKKVFSYNPQSNSWTTLQDFPLYSIGGVGFSVGNKAYIGMGSNYPGATAANEIWTYNP